MKTLVALSLFLAQEDPRKLAVDRNPDVRIRAVRAFGQRPEPEAVRALIPFLADSHPKVRLRTVKALSRLKEPDAIDFFRTDPDATLVSGQRTGRLYFP